MSRYRPLCQAAVTEVSWLMKVLLFLMLTVVQYNPMSLIDVWRVRDISCEFQAVDIVILVGARMKLEEDGVP